MRFDFDETYGDDYLYFYASQLTDELNERDTDARAAGSPRRLPRRRYARRDGQPPSIHRPRLVVVAPA